MRVWSPRVAKFMLYSLFWSLYSFLNSLICHSVFPSGMNTPSCPPTPHTMFSWSWPFCFFLFSWGCLSHSFISHLVIYKLTSPDWHNFHSWLVQWLLSTLQIFLLFLPNIKALLRINSLLVCLNQPCSLPARSVCPLLIYLPWMFFHHTSSTPPTKFPPIPQEGVHISPPLKTFRLTWARNNLCWTP